MAAVLKTAANCLFVGSWLGDLIKVITGRAGNGVGAVFLMCAAIEEGSEALKHPQSADLLLVLALLCVSLGNSSAQNTASGLTKHVLFLNGTNNGHTIIAAVGQSIQTKPARGAREQSR